MPNFYIFYILGSRRLFRVLAKIIMQLSGPRRRRCAHESCTVALVGHCGILSPTIKIPLYPDHTASGIHPAKRDSVRKTCEESEIRVPS